MSFPVIFEHKFMFDLRHIPFIIGALYIGFPAALTAFITIISYRYFLGGDGIYINFLAMTLLLLVVPLLKNNFSKLKRQNKVLFSTGISVIFVSLVMLLIIFTRNINSVEFYVFAISSVIISTISMWFVSYLIEEMSYNKKVQKRMLLTEKLSIISDLSASISHEIRNPLTVTEGFLQLLYDNDLSVEKKKSYLDLALLELKRGEMIITDFLSLTKNKIENNASINVVKELEYVLNIINPYALIHNVDIKMESEVSAEARWVEGENNPFQQTLINLVKNAIEAMPNGGNLGINVSIDRDTMVIKIKDSGIGMSKQEVLRLGTPYFTTKEKGTGLGTTLIFSTVHAMKGTIHVESEKGQGTTFSLMLPIILETEPRKIQAS